MRGKHLYKLLFIFALFVGVVSFSPTTQAYGDSDNIPSSTENGAINNGDGNDDGIKDRKQSTVASMPNPNDTESPDAYVTLEISNPDSESKTSWQIDQFNPVDPNTLPSQPDGTTFPVGLFDIQLSKKYGCGCGEQPIPELSETDSVRRFDEQVGDTVHLKLIFDRVMDTSKWTTLKYDPGTHTYMDYSANVTFGTMLIDGVERTVVEWNVTDGGLGDEDGVVNCKISDPIGPAVPVATTASIVTPTATVAVAQPQLANTGLAANAVLTIAGVLIALSVAIFPKRALRR